MNHQHQIHLPWANNNVTAYFSCACLHSKYLLASRNVMLEASPATSSGEKKKNHEPACDQYHSPNN